MSENKMDSGQVLALLRQKYEQKGRYVCAAEVNQGTGSGMGRRADFMAIGCWASDGFEIIGFEVKVSRSDWLSELKNTEKAEAIMRFCTHWYVAAPKGIVKPEELPTGWGYMEVTEHGCRTAQAAIKRNNEPFTPGFQASLIRRISEGAATQQELMLAQSKGYQRGKESATASHDREIRALKERIQGLEADIENVRLFEKETGIPVTKVRSYWRGHSIPPAEAVKFIMDGGLEPIKRNAASMADDLERISKRLKEAAGVTP